MTGKRSQYLLPQTEDCQKKRAKPANLENAVIRSQTKLEERKQMISLASNRRQLSSYAASLNREMRNADQLIVRHAVSGLFATFEYTRDNYQRWRLYRTIVAEFCRHPGMAAELGISHDNRERIAAIARDVAMGVSVRAAISG
jgi:hypothetical protein